MKRLLICFAAIAFLAVDQTELAAQSGTRTGSYQSILTNSYNNGFNGGYDATNSFATPVNSHGTGYPGITTGYQQAQPMQSVAPVQGQFGPAPISQTGPVVGSGCNSCSTGTAAPMAAGSVGGNVYAGGGGGCDTGGFASGMIGGANCDAPVYASAVGGGNARNYFFGLNGLVFDRDFEDDVFLTRDPAGNSLLSTDADTGTLGGLEFFLGSRNACGNGFEARYWGLFADEATATLAGGTYQTYLTDLSGLFWPTSGENLQTVFDRGTANTITRDNEIHNVEFNFLRRGGCYQTRWGQCASFELLHGFRWFEFNEEFHWDITSAAAPTSIFFDTEVRNTLLGYQLGSRSSICLGQRLAFNWGTKFGVFNNRARATQSIIDENGVYATVGPGGPDYDFDDDKNDVSLLGELDLGFAYNVSCNSRLNLGYRAIGVSGIALAPDQYSNFNTATAIRDVQTNGSLILNGAYFGLEFCR